MPSIWCSRRFRDRPGRQTRGFSLVEIMVVVTMISLLGMIAVPTLRKLQIKARASATANDLRVFEASFQAYATEKGGFPAAADPGVLPSEMVGRIKETDWSKVSPLGGHYAWEGNQVFGDVRCKAAISINTSGDSALTSDAEQLETLDRMVDDGNLNTGNLIFAGSGSVVWIIEH